MKLNFYEECRKLFNELKPFAYNTREQVKELIEEQRPNEPEDIKRYRMKIFKNELLSPYNKIIIKLKSINKAEGFDTIFPEKLSDTANGEDLENYTENKYPYFGGFWAWFWNFRFKGFLTDANSFTVILPKSFDVPANEYLRPVASQVFIDFVTEYEPNEILEFVYGNPYPELCYKKISITKEFIIKYEKQNVNDKMEWAQTESYINQTGLITAVRSGGFYEMYIDGKDVYCSVLRAIVPFFQKAVSTLTDDDAAFVVHTYPESVSYENEPCNTCNATGRVLDPNGACDTNGNRLYITCRACDGKRWQSSPYGNRRIRPALEGEPQIPHPAKYYIEKPIEILKIISERVKEKIAGGYEALGFDYFNNVALNQSGKAKEMDRSEGEATMHSVALTVKEHLYYCYLYMAAWRQPALGEERWRAQIPSITIPDRFDIITADIEMQKIAQMKEAGFSGQMISSRELKYAKKEYGEKSPEYLKLYALHTLDPFPGLSLADKIMLQNSPAVDMFDVFVSVNLANLLNEANLKTDDFFMLPTDKQKEIVSKLALSRFAKRKLLPDMMADEDEM